jgi:penicillin-binding protein 2
MSEPHIFFTEVNERQGAFHRRAFLMGGLSGLGLLALSARLMHLQLIDAGRYRTMAEGNQFNYRLVPPPRGRILDRNGIELAANRPNFRILVSRDEVDDIDVTLDALSTLILITPERRKQLVREFQQSSRFVPVAVADDLSWEEFSRINARLPELPGVTPDMSEVRVYNYGGAFAHVIGYVSKVSADDLKKVLPTEDQLLLHHPGFRIGKQGVEKALDLRLRGVAGAQKVEVDARGRVVGKPSKGDIPATPGKDVVLSLDADIQNRALEVFGEESGAAVVMDIRNGDVLCMASAPSFDANKFVKGMSGPDYRMLANYERRPLLDKALTGTYPPGSTFKMMTGLAALEAGINAEERVHCSGGMYFGGRTFHCWKHGGHGSQNLHDAIKNSCDVYFYQMALRVGPDKIAGVARAFGLGQTFDIGIEGQKKGIVPDSAWKQARFKEKWYPGESLSYGIGQGYLTVNALQLAVMVARLAHGKKALVPRLIRKIGGEEQPSGAEAPDLPFSREHLDLVRGGMAAVANDTSGTAYRASQLGLGPILMAGKTGSAQVRSFDKAKSRKNTGLPWKLRDHALFVAFAPYDNPRYAMSVIVQHGGAGSRDAAPRAREIMRVALLKDPDIRGRIEQPLPMPDMGMMGDEATEGEAPPIPTTGPAPVLQPASIPTMPMAPGARR